MKKRFIVLIDFSNHSEWLLIFSYNWALQAGAELILIHHVTQLMPGLGDSQFLSEMKRDNEKKAIEKLRSFTENIIGADLAIKYYADSYSVSAAIVKLEEPNSVDFIFVGINDKTNIEKLITPGTAIQLSHEIRSIIIALPTSAFDFRFDSLYVGIKLSIPLNEIRFEDLLSIIAFKVKHIRFFSVVKTPVDRQMTTSYLEHLCARYEKNIPASYEILESENPSVAIKKYLKAKKSILVVQKGPRNFMDIFRTFFTIEIVHNAQIPVIILP